MSIFIWKDGQQQGPFPESEILEHLSSGRLSSNDLAWNEEYNEWKPLSELLRIDSPRPIPTPASHHEPPELPPEASANVATSKSFWKVPRDNAIATACLAKKQAYRNKLALIDLSTADYRTGRKAYDGGISLPGHEDLIAQLIEVQIGIAALNETAGRKPLTLAEKAKTALHAAATAAKVQAFRLHKGRLIMVLGTQLRQAPHVDPSLTTEIDSAKAVHERITVLDAEIKKLEGTIHGWTRRSLRIIASLLTSGLAWMKVGMTAQASDRRANQHFQALTAMARLKDVITKRKLLSLSIAGVILGLVILSLRSQRATVPVPAEVWRTIPEEGQLILGQLRESGPGIKLVQKLLDYGAEQSHKEKTQVLDVTPLTYKVVNGKDYVAIATTQLSHGAKQRVGYVLDLKAQEFYSLSLQDYNTFSASGNVQLKNASPFAAIVLTYALANRENPDLSTDPEILKELSAEDLAHWKSFQNPENLIKETQTTFDNSKVGIKVTGATPLCYKRIGGEIYGLYSFTEVLNGSAQRVGLVFPYKGQQKWSFLSEEDYNYVLAFNNLSKAKPLDPSTLVAQATPAPTPEVDPGMNNLAVFGDMLKQAFDTTQNKQSVEKFLGNFVQDLTKMKKVPRSRREDDAYRDLQDQNAEDALKASEDQQKRFREGMDMIQRDNEEKQEREREQEERDRYQQYLDQQQRNQRNNN